MKKVLCVVGARPNFVKIAPILRELARVEAAGAGLHAVLVHTEQHYDDALSAVFFADLQLRPPAWTLGVGSASHAVQTAEVMKRFEPVLLSERPDLVVVVGDVNSTLACALTAAKLGIPVAHVEAGLRSFDRTMPEEINRVVTDSLATLLLTSEQSGSDNLRREGHPPERIHFVGNVMIDSLEACRRLANRSDALARLGLRPGADPGYALVTLHRAANVDDAATCRRILGALAELAAEMPVIFAAHPRTRQRIAEFGLGHLVRAHAEDAPPLTPGDRRVTMVPPLRYIDFLRLMAEARVVLTDSGGIQEETTCLGVPCLTLRDNTERPVTVAMGSNQLVGTDPERILARARAARGAGRTVRRPPLWDGRAAARIVDVLRRSL